eukprot:m.107157 g.107157  ORF g.107157 m.107157 type:complete len:642 (-) comp9172_c0_seq2:1182-3107(-)
MPPWKSGSNVWWSIGVRRVGRASSLTHSPFSACNSSTPVVSPTTLTSFISSLFRTPTTISSKLLTGVAAKNGIMNIGSSPPLWNTLLLKPVYSRSLQQMQCIPLSHISVSFFSTSSNGNLGNRGDVHVGKDSLFASSSSVHSNNSNDNSDHDGYEMEENDDEDDEEDGEEADEEDDEEEEETHLVEDVNLLEEEGELHAKNGLDMILADPSMDIVEQAQQVVNGAVDLSPGQLRLLFDELEEVGEYQLMLQILDRQYSLGKPVSEQMWSAVLLCLAINGAEKDFTKTFEVADMIHKHSWQDELVVKAARVLSLLRNSKEKEALSIIGNHPESAVRLVMFASQRLLNCRDYKRVALLWEKLSTMNVGLTYSLVARKSRAFLIQDDNRRYFRHRCELAAQMLLLTANLPFSISSEFKFRHSDFMFTTLISRLAKWNLPLSVSLYDHAMANARLSKPFPADDLWLAVKREKDIPMAWKLLSIKFRNKQPLAHEDVKQLGETYAHYVKVYGEEGVVTTTAKNKALLEKYSQKKDVPTKVVQPISVSEKKERSSVRFLKRFGLPLTSVKVSVRITGRRPSLKSSPKQQHSPQQGDGEENDDGEEVKNVALSALSKSQAESIARKLNSSIPSKSRKKKGKSKKNPKT